MDATKVKKTEAKSKEINFWLVARVGEFGFDMEKGRSLEVKFSQSTCPSGGEIVKKLDENTKYDPKLTVFDIRVYQETENDHWIRVLF